MSRVGKSTTTQHILLNKYDPTSAKGSSSTNCDNRQSSSYEFMNFIAKRVDNEND